MKRIWTYVLILVLGALAISAGFSGPAFADNIPQSPQKEPTYDDFYRANANAGKIIYTFSPDGHIFADNEQGEMVDVTPPNILENLEKNPLPEKSVFDFFSGLFGGGGSQPKGMPPTSSNDTWNFLPDFVPGESVYENDTSPQQDPPVENEASNAEPVVQENPDSAPVLPLPPKVPEAIRDTIPQETETQVPDEIDYEKILVPDSVMFDSARGTVVYIVDGVSMSESDYHLKALEKAHESAKQSGDKTETKRFENQLNKLAKEKGFKSYKDYQKNKSGAGAEGKKSSKDPEQASGFPDSDPFAVADAINARVPAFGPSDFSSRDFEVSTLEIPSQLSGENHVENSDDEKQGGSSD